MKHAMRILVFGGDYAIRDLLCAMLSHCGTCLALSDSDEAMEQFSLALEQRRRFHLVVCDLYPRGRGRPDDMMQTLFAMRALEEHACICPCERSGMVTVGAFMEPGGLGHVLQDLAPAAFLRKPFDDDDLQSVLLRLGFFLPTS